MFDNTRDILYNSTLIIANNKFNNKNEVIFDDVVESISKQNYLRDAIKYFKNYQLNIIENYIDTLEAFVDTTNMTFPKYNSSDLHLKGYCVLGAFPTYSNAIQRDYNQIINYKVINNLVKELFVGSENNKPDNKHQEVKEEDIYYINEVNYSQEKVLSLIDKEEALVVQGPPGTGKSQTITSLISQAVLHNKKVLVVSEKKTA